MATDMYNREWITDMAIPIVNSYGGNITIRQLHYRLVSKGMTNTQRHYKRVCAAMEKARWNGLLEFDDFVDHERETIGKTVIDVTDPEVEANDTEQYFRYWMENYRKNRWENQPYYVEVFIEKKALQGVFQDPCSKLGVALNPCKGYPSLTYVYDAMQRLQSAYDEGKNPVILYFGDHDPSGDDIPRSIQDNICRMGFSDFTLERIALTKEQVIQWNLPPAPTKSTDSRSGNWDGLGQVELDAVEPADLQNLVYDAVDRFFDDLLHEELKQDEAEEKEIYKGKVREIMTKIMEE